MSCSFFDERSKSGYETNPTHWNDAVLLPSRHVPSVLSHILLTGEDREARMEHKRGRIATTAHLTPRDVPPGWGGILCAFVFVVKKYPLLNQCAVDCRLKWRDFFTAAQKSCALHVLVKTIASKSWPYYVHHNLTKIVISIDGGSVVLLWVHFGPIVFLKEVVKNSLRGTSLLILDRWSAFWARLSLYRSFPC